MEDDVSTARRQIGVIRNGRRQLEMVTLLALIFIAADVGAVVLALLWLHERRAIADKTDARYHGRHSRPR